MSSSCAPNLSSLQERSWGSRWRSNSVFLASIICRVTPLFSSTHAFFAGGRSPLSLTLSEASPSSSSRSSSSVGTQSPLLNLSTFSLSCSSLTRAAVLVVWPQPQQVLTVVMLLVAQARHDMVEQQARLTPLLQASPHSRQLIEGG